MNNLFGSLPEIESVVVNMGRFLTFICIVAAIFNLVYCLFGYKLFKLQVILTGLLSGGIVGFLIGVILAKPILVLLVIAGAILGAIWAMKFYKFGVFVSASSCTTAVLILISADNGGLNLGKLLAAVVFGILAGVMGVLWHEKIIIFYTAISGGVLAGLCLKWGFRLPLPMGILIGFCLAALGVWIQFQQKNKETGHTAPAVSTQHPSRTSPYELRLSSVSGEAGKKLGNVNFTAFKQSKPGNVHTNHSVLVGYKGNYWCNGLPMIITEVRIVRTTSDPEAVYLNFSLQNLTSQPIVGFYYDVTCYNLLKEELEKLSGLSILDLYIQEGQHWFTESLIKLPNTTTRKCILTIKNVILGDESIWSNEQGLHLDEILDVQPLGLSSELGEEYHLQLAERQKMRNAASVYAFSPSQETDYWYCSCGQFNTSPTRCVCCKLDKADLFVIYDEQKLEEDRTRRIAEKLRIEAERQQKITEQAELAKQKSAEIAEQAQRGLTAATSIFMQLLGVLIIKIQEGIAYAKEHMSKH